MGNKKCVICGFDRVVDRAHLIPKRVIERIAGMKKFETYEGKHIVYLCRNHHFLFDTNRLTEQEKSILKPYFKKVEEHILLIANSNLIPKNKGAIQEQSSKVKALNKWINSLIGYILQRNV